MPPESSTDRLASDTISKTNADSMDIHKTQHSVSFLDATDVDSNDKTFHGSNNEPLYLRWSRLHKSVQIKENNSGMLRGSIAAAPVPQSNASVHNQGSSQKIILDAVSGYAAPGEVLAMMGPSGSGKTSLLNCLSGRTPYDSGVVSVNGRPLGGQDMKRLMAKIAYVRQADIFFEHLTVRDQLGYTAFLRLPEAWSAQTKLSEVERVIRLLRLTKVADSKIQLLSGGEKKRVNIGTELLTDPSILLLDEPTSGLDSTSAVALIRMLQDLAKSGGPGTKGTKTIVTSIHQPSSALFRSFDRLIMLAEGHVVFFGTPYDSLHYLKTQKVGCPDGYNAADHWMDLLVKDSAIEDSTTTVIIDANEGSKKSETGETDKHFSSDPVQSKSTGQIRKETNHSVVMSTRERLIQAWDSEAVAEQMDSCVERDSNSATVKDPLGENVSKYNTGWMLQYRTLVHRSLKNSRSAIFTPINIIKSCALGLVSGLLWFQMSYTESRVFDRSSYFFFTMTFWVFDAMFQSFMAFPQERTVILKERASGSYRLSAYFMGKTTSEMPTRLVLPLLYMIISFFMASISNKFSTFIATTLISLLSVMAGESIGLFVGATIYDMEKGMTAMTVISLALALLGGFFVENVPSFLQWAKFVSPFKYAYDASLPLVFDDPVPCDGSGALEGICGGSDTGFAQPEEVVAYLGVQGSVGFNVGILIVFGLMPRYVAYLALRAKKEGDR
ncbi:ABC-2 type transporter [Nitzschia inconspicua]|uniref:ABC-2 type transporter n=2 Tax=Nitzschia inconspicua TaxID=303405 RepID=A0A9K3KJ80_9STRA|nr:ABC-2 type transporter [Nitzschia inconspicua]